MKSFDAKSSLNRWKSLETQITVVEIPQPWAVIISCTQSRSGTVSRFFHNLTFKFQCHRFFSAFTQNLKFNLSFLDAEISSINSDLIQSIIEWETVWLKNRKGRSWPVWNCIDFHAFWLLVLAPTFAALILLPSKQAVMDIRFDFAITFSTDHSTIAMKVRKVPLFVDNFQAAVETKAAFASRAFHSSWLCCCYPHLIIQFKSLLLLDVYALIAIPFVCGKQYENSTREEENFAAFACSFELCGGIKKLWWCSGLRDRN